ncbi:glycosyltransferase [Vagococcus sp. JNUCC 83]
MNSIVLIPIFEPTDKTISFMKELSQEPLIVLVVDDGSGSLYQEKFQQLTLMGITVLSYPINQGKGYALKYGIKYIQNTFPTYHVVTADGDGQHAVKDIKRMVQRLNHLPTDIILLGVRHFDKKSTPTKSYYGNRMTSLIYYLSSGIKLEDTQTGLRGFHYQMIPELLSIPGNRFEYEMNQLIDLVQDGYTIEMLEIETIYENNNEHSHFKAIQDSYLIYRPLLLFLVSSLSSALVDVLSFLLLAALFGNQPTMLLLATIGSRFLSGLFNFQLNRKLVFKDKQKMHQSFWKYGVLFSAQLFFSWLGVMVLSSLFQSILICKVLVDSTLFFISFSIQKRFVFE